MVKFNQLVDKYKTSNIHNIYQNYGNNIGILLLKFINTGNSLWELKVNNSWLMVIFLYL